MTHGLSQKKPANENDELLQDIITQIKTTIDQIINPDKDTDRNKSPLKSLIFFIEMQKNREGHKDLSDYALGVLKPVFIPLTLLSVCARGGFYQDKCMEGPALQLWVSVAITFMVVGAFLLFTNIEPQAIGWTLLFYGVNLLLPSEAGYAALTDSSPKQSPITNCKQFIINLFQMAADDIKATPAKYVALLSLIRLNNDEDAGVIAKAKMIIEGGYSSQNYSQIIDDAKFNEAYKNSHESTRSPNV